MLILEGADGVGKTTLLHRLLEEPSLEEFHLSEGRDNSPREKLWEGTRERTYGALASAIHNHRDAHIWDRLFLSELVYFKYMNRKCQFTLGERAYILRALRALGTPIVFCKIPLDDARANMNRDEQMQGVAANFDEIYMAYEGMFARLIADLDPFNIVVFDYRQPQAYFDLIHKTLRPYLTRKKERQWRPSS